MNNVKNSFQIIQEVNLWTKPSKDELGLLDRLRGAVHLKDDDFDERYLKPLLHICDWVQELPACKDHHFGLGGAVNFAMHVGFAAVRLSESYIFTPTDKSEHRYFLEKEYQYAAYLAAIFTTLSYPLTFLQVSNQDGEIWNKRQPLNRFSSSYDLNWIVNTSLESNASFFHIAKIFPLPLLNVLHISVAEELMRTLSPQVNASGSTETTMQKCVKTAIKKVIELEQKRISKHFDQAKLEIYQANDIEINDGENLEAQNKRSDGDLVLDNLSKNDGAENIVAEKNDNKKTTSVPEPEPANSENESGLFDPKKIFSRAVSEVMRLLKEDLANGKRDVAKIKQDQLGLIIPSSFFSNYGLSLAMIESELRKKSMVVKKEGQTYILEKKLGGWLTENVDKKLIDLFEVVDG